MPADAYAETIEEKEDGSRTHKDYLVTFAETAIVSPEVADTIDLDDINLGAKPEGRSEIFYHKRHGRWHHPKSRPRTYVTRVIHDRPDQFGGESTQEW